MISTLSSVENQLNLHDRTLSFSACSSVDSDSDDDMGGTMVFCPSRGRQSSLAGVVQEMGDDMLRDLGLGAIAQKAKDACSTTGASSPAKIRKMGPRKPIPLTFRKINDLLSMRKTDIPKDFRLTLFLEEKGATDDVEEVGTLRLEETGSFSVEECSDNNRQSLDEIVSKINEERAPKITTGKEISPPTKVAARSSYGRCFSALADRISALARKILRPFSLLFSRIRGIFSRSNRDPSKKPGQEARIGNSKVQTSKL